MALLSGLMRTAAITGRTDTINAWFAGRQGKRWAEQTVSAAFPMAAPGPAARPPAAAPRRPADPARTLRELTELHEQGVITDVELDGLRARLSV